MADLSQWIVLLVDDEPDSLNLIHDMLTLYGAQVHRAVNGKEGMALLKTLVPTLIVADLSMPKPDGWDLISVIRTTPALATVPVVAITAYYSDKVLEEAAQVGFNAVIPKPIKLNSLLTKLQQVISEQ